MPKRYVPEVHDRHVVAVVWQVAHGDVQVLHCWLPELANYPGRQVGTQIS